MTSVPFSVSVRGLAVDAPACVTLLLLPWFSDLCSGTLAAGGFFFFFLGWVGNYFDPFLCLHTALGPTNMALNITGVVMMVVFYILILGTGLWGAKKSKKAERTSSGDRTAVVLLGDRRISLCVGIFTMTGMLAGGTPVVFANWNCKDSIRTAIAVHYVKGFRQFLQEEFIFFFTNKCHLPASKIVWFYQCNKITTKPKNPKMNQNCFLVTINSN